MPYVSPERRKLLDPALEKVAVLLDSRGDLNYAITELVTSQVKAVGYAALEAAVGVLEAAKLEFYRRVAAPYEDKKCVEHGDVYFDDAPIEPSELVSEPPAGPPPSGRKKRGDDHRTSGASAVAP